MITYQTERGTATIFNASVPGGLETIEIWTVTRITNGFGWHVGKYADEETAKRIAEILTDASTKEIA